MHDESYPVGDVHGHHEKLSVSEVDDIHNPPDQAQSGSHKGVDHAVQKPVQSDLQKECHAFRVPPFDTAPQRQGLSLRQNRNKENVENNTRGASEARAFLWVFLRPHALVMVTLRRYHILVEGLRLYLQASDRSRESWVVRAPHPRDPWGRFACNCLPAAG